MSGTSSNNCCSRKHKSLESESLLSSISQKQNLIDVKHRLIIPLFCSPIRLCIKFKAVILILYWTIIVGGLFFIAYIVLLSFLISEFRENVSVSYVLLYSSFALVYILCPLSEFIADVYCGRFKTIIISLTLCLCSSFICVLCVFLIDTGLAIVTILLLICVVAAAIGGVSYNVNFIEFGLDQLLEAPSRHQALFVHWAKWCYDLLSVVIALSMILATLSYVVVIPLIAILLIMLFLLLLFGCWKRHWFYSESVHYNPYKIVIKVLKFVLKHKYPLQRSAFTYCDDERPSRLDFAKERFGGPFSTEQVEDVKTLFRIVAVLLSIGPVFVLDVPTSFAAMYMIGLHFGRVNFYTSTGRPSVMEHLICSCARYFISTIFLPVYMWIVFSLLRNRTPKIFCRLGLGIFIYLLGILCILVNDTVGHIKDHGNQAALCIFNLTFNTTTLSYEIPHLNMHWAVFIPISVLIGIGPTLVTVTIFEFLSAQSPHSMKGLLLGTYYCITGIYQFISSVVLVPFALPNFWETSTYTGCEFGYYLFTFISGTIGFILFLVTVRWYKYRVREDQPYDQRFVVDIYDRYLNQANELRDSESD